MPRRRARVTATRPEPEALTGASGAAAKPGLPLRSDCERRGAPIPKVAGPGRGRLGLVAVVRPVGSAGPGGPDFGAMSAAIITDRIYSEVTKTESKGKAHKRLRITLSDA